MITIIKNVVLQNENNPDKDTVHYLVNDRYEIYINDGCVYDTKEAKDIPQNIFYLRDLLLKSFE